MGSKMSCPGCGSYGSDVQADYSEGNPCRHCGLSHDAAAEILAVQGSRADEAIKKQLTEALKAKGIAEAKLRKAEHRLEAIKEALEAEDPEWL